MYKNYMYELGIPNFNRIGLIMRLTTLILIATFMQVSAAGFGQKISMSKSNAPLKEVLKKLRTQSGYNFVYTDDLLEMSRSVDIKVYEAELEDVLVEIFNKQPLTYSINKNTITLREKLKPASKDIPASVKTVDIVVRGQVKDAKGETLIGVSVKVKGTSIGTTTDTNGSYILNLADPNSTLVFSYIGFITQEISVNNQILIDVKLLENPSSLDEVVVVGFGTQKRSDVTGSISSVKAEQIRNLPVASLAEAIGGRVSGVQTSKGSGEAGGGTDIFIRGATSIRNVQPLYIVDGVRMGTGNSFNMTDVENIEILKDASSASIYGVEAAGGVILVTTKKGKKGDKMAVNFNSYFGVRDAVNLPTLLNRADYISARKILGIDNAAWNQNNTNTNWINEMYGSATEQKYDLSLSGGGERSTYYISSGYYNEEGIRRLNDFKRYSFRLNTDHKINKNLTIGQFLYINARKTRPPGADGNGGIPYRSIPMMDVYDSTREGGWAGVPVGFNGDNPVGGVESTVFDNNDFGVEGNVFGDLKIIEGLNLRATVGGWTGGAENSRFNQTYDFGVIKNGTRTLTKSIERNRSLTALSVLTYDKAFGKHDFKLMGGAEVISMRNNRIEARADNFPVLYSPSFSTSTGAENTRFASSPFGESNQIAQFGRFNYSYAGKYLLQATVRRDGTNKFVGDNTYGVFPSVSAAWRISEEAFIKDNVQWLSNLKLRAGYGVLGSIAGINDFIYQQTYRDVNVHSFDGTNAVTGFGNTRFANADIQWEVVTTKNIALEAGLLQNRLNFSVDFYDKQTTDMLFDVNLPPSSGLGRHNDEYRATTNIGRISNRGVEFETNWNDKVGKLTYGIGGNASFNRNKVLRVGDVGSIINEGGTAYLPGAMSRTQDGSPIGMFWGFIADGIFQTDAEAAASAQKTPSFTPKSGDLRFRDINGDNKITDADKTQIGNPWPKIFYGITTDLGYKGFDMRAFFQGQGGVDNYNTTKGIQQTFYSDWNATSEIFNTSKFGNNNITDMPSVYHVAADGKILPDPNGNYKQQSSYFVESGSYLKLRNLQLGYTLPASFTNRIKTQSARVYLSGHNILTMTKYSGLDPELGGGVRNRGIETEGLYPQTRFWSLGLDVRF